MAQRMVKRAGIAGEQGVAVSFGFVSFPAALLLDALASFGLLGDIASIILFSLHRIALVTDQNAYVYKSRPFHRPGELISKHPVGPGTVERVRGKMTFQDGTMVYHSPFFTFRAKRVADAANGTPS